MDRLLLFQSLKQMSFRQFHQLSGAGLIVDSVMGFTVSRGRPPPPCFHLEGMDACIYDYLASVDILALLTGRYENPFLFLSLSHLYVQGRRTSY